jgi:hypothetical protein
MLLVDGKHDVMWQANQGVVLLGTAVCARQQVVWCDMVVYARDTSAPPPAAAVFEE